MQDTVSESKADVLCRWCPPTKRHHVPAWVPDAVARYVRGETPTEIAELFGLTDSKVWRAVSHAGVGRTRQGDAKRRSNLARKRTIGKVGPQPCACGCDQLTSGEVYRDKRDKTWKHPAFVKGHRKNTHAPHTKRASLEEVGSAPFVAEVRSQLLAQGRTFSWLHSAVNGAGKTGTLRPMLYGKGQKRPETIARVATVLHMDIASCMVQAGWPDPSSSPITMRFLQRLGHGQSRGQIAAELAVGYDLISDAISGENSYLRPDTIEKLAEPLALTCAEIDLEVDRAKSGHGKAMLLGWNGMAPERQRAHVEKLQSALGPEATRKSAESRTIALDETRLAELLTQGMSYKSVAKVLEVSPQTVQRRAQVSGVRSRFVKRSRTSRKRRTRKAREVLRENSGQRLAAARSDANVLGPYVHLVDRDTFASTHKISHDVAQRILEEARARLPGPS